MNCRICLEEHPDESREAAGLISPCCCRSLVHRACLDEWRATRKDAFDACEVCQFRYMVNPVSDGGDRSRVWRFRALVARDTMLVFIALQIVVVLLGYVVHRIDVDGYIPAHMPSWFADSPNTTYYICGVALLLVLTGLCGSIYMCASGGCRSNGGGTFCYMGDCSGSNSEAGAAALAFIVIVVLIILAVIGVFLLAIAGTAAFQHIVQRHVRVAWLRQETQKYPVHDLFGNQPATAATSMADGYARI